MPTEADCCSENIPGRPCSCSACPFHGHGDHDRLMQELMTEVEEEMSRKRAHARPPHGGG